MKSEWRAAQSCFQKRSRQAATIHEHRLAPSSRTPMTAPSIQNARGANRFRLQVKTLIQSASCPSHQARQAQQTLARGVTA